VFSSLPQNIEDRAKPVIVDAVAKDAEPLLAVGHPVRQRALCPTLLYRSPNAILTRWKLPRRNWIARRLRRHPQLSSVPPITGGLSRTPKYAKLPVHTTKTRRVGNFDANFVNRR
jgi:hypothetical protein